MRFFSHCCGLHTPSVQTLWTIIFRAVYQLWKEISSCWDGRPFGHNSRGPKSGRCRPPFGGGGLSQVPIWHNVALAEAYLLPSGVLIHPAVWPQQSCAEKWEGCCAPFRGGAGSPSNTMWPGPKPTSIPSGILIIQPFGHNTPTLRRDRTGQRSDSTGEPFHRTVAQKRSTEASRCTLFAGDQNVSQSFFARPQVVGSSSWWCESGTVALWRQTVGRHEVDDDVV